MHRAFHSLKEKGLLTYIYQGKNKIYQPIEPKQLLTFLEEKKNQVENIIPYLEERQKLARNKAQATVYEGIKGVKELITLMIDTDSKDYMAYGGPHAGGDVLTFLFWDKFHKTKSEKGIKSRLVFHTNLSEWGEHIKKYGLINIKFTNRDFEGITETIICGGKVAIIIYSEKPFGFLIEEREAYESYKKFFEVIWEGF